MSDCMIVSVQLSLTIEQLVAIEAMREEWGLEARTDVIQRIIDEVLVD